MRRAAIAARGERAIMTDKLTAIKLITKERQRQIDRNGYTPDHDREHIHGEIALAAICYASPKRVYIKKSFPTACGCRSVGECPHVFGEYKYVDPWPWEEENDKRLSDFDKKMHNALLDKWQRIRNLVKAGALIAAEIDRLQAMDDRVYDIVRKDDKLLSALQ